MENERPNELKRVETGYSQGPFPLCCFFYLGGQTLNWICGHYWAVECDKERTLALGAVSYRLTWGTFRRDPEGG